MSITIEITDEKQIAQIERLRGEKPVEELLAAVVQAGLNAIEQFQHMQKNAVRFEGAKEEFKTTDVAAITAALKENNKENPIVLEVNRLVGAYTAQMGELAKKNGNRLPARMQVNTQTPIERVAFDITAQVIRQAVQKSDKAA
jgi:hypothetical protein